MDASPSEEMHHIEPIATSPSKRMDRRNWLAVCRSCHEEIEYDMFAGQAVKRWSEKNYEDVING
jgi:hypothetical protein